METENLLRLYKENQEPPRLYRTEITRKVLKLCEKYGISTRIKRWIPNDYRKVNYQISENLWNESYSRQNEGKSYSSYQKAAINLCNLKESIVSVYQKGKLYDLEWITPKIGEKVVSQIKNKKSNTLDDFF